MDYENINIEENIVLNKNRAIGFLDYMSGECAKQVKDGEIDSDAAVAVIGDIAGMIVQIIKNDWKFVQFYECPMAASGVGIRKGAI